MIGHRIHSPCLIRFRLRIRSRSIKRRPLPSDAHSMRKLRIRTYHVVARCHKQVRQSPAELHVTEGDVRRRHQGLECVALKRAKRQQNELPKPKNSQERRHFRRSSRLSSATNMALSSKGPRVQGTSKIAVKAGRLVPVVGQRLPFAVRSASAVTEGDFC